MPAQIPTEQELATMVQRAADGDWRASAWLLSNAPATRAEWGPREPMLQALRQQRLSFVALIDQGELTPQQRTCLIGALAALPLEPEGLDLGHAGVDLLEVAA